MLTRYVSYDTVEVSSLEKHDLFSYDGQVYEVAAGIVDDFDEVEVLVLDEMDDPDILVLPANTSVDLLRVED